MNSNNLLIAIKKKVSFNFRGINVRHAHSVIFIISSYKAIFIPEAFYEIN